VSEAQARATWVGNVRFAAAEAKKLGMPLLIEPINSFDMPGYFVNRPRQAIALMDEVGADNVFLQYDIYHAQRMEGELAATIQKHLPRIAHIQLADNPGRNEPGTGEINYPYLFQHLEAISYRGWIGCEYKPKTSTVEGLGWMKGLST
jgi:hydroxypyruvate isomerase